MSADTKFIVWDWNGTLLDDVDICVASMNQYLGVAGKSSIDAEGYRHCFDVPITRLYQNLGFTEAELESGLEKWQTIFHDHYEAHAIICQLRAGAKEVLAATRQRQVVNFILSNHFEHSITGHLKRLKACHYIHQVMAFESRETQFKQPKGQRFAAHMQDAGLLPANGIIIGDTPEEVAIGHDLGLSTITITGGYASEARLRAAEPDHLVHGLRDMLPILRQKGFVP